MKLETGLEFKKEITMVKTPNKQVHILWEIKKSLHIIASNMKAKKQE